MNPNEKQNDPQAIAIPGFHQWVESFLIRRFGREGKGHVLDVGAGHGAFSLRLKKLGYQVSACDMHAELFQAEDVEFKTADAAQQLPWPEKNFDRVIALEITEHIDGLMPFFREVHRVLKPGGDFIFSTPNILSFKSRVRFLLTGFFYSFKPLADEEANSVIDHITPLPFDLYAYRLRQCGLRVQELTTDKWQRSSLWGLVLVPIIAWMARLKFPRSSLARQQNSWNCLMGRKLVIWAKKK